MRPRIVPTLFFAVVLISLASTVPAAASSAKGNLVVDGKPLALKYAVAFTGPDTFDETKEAVIVLITSAPIAADRVKDANSIDALRQLADDGLILKFRAGESYHLTVRHPILKGQELQTSGSASFMKDVTVTGDTVSGTVITGMGDEKMFEHTVTYSIAFQAPIAKHLPLEQAIVLAPNARKLGAGGGEAGKAYLKEKCGPPPVIPTDPKGMEAYMRKEGLLAEFENEAKKQGHTVTRAEIDDQVKQFGKFAKLGAAMRTKDCKVLGGAEDGKVAILQVEAFAMGSRGRTDITMVKEDGVWKVKKEGSWSSIP